MTDRELLELAAKAAGLEIHWPRQAERDEDGYGNSGLWIVNGSTCWNPLTNDGDALRLAVKLRMDIASFESAVRVTAEGGEDCYEPGHGDPYAATRRAIVRAAAAIGQSRAATSSGDAL